MAFFDASASHYNIASASVNGGTRIIRDGDVMAELSFAAGIETTWPELPGAIRAWIDDPMPKFPGLTITVGTGTLGRVAMTMSLPVATGAGRRERRSCSLYLRRHTPDRLGRAVALQLDSLHTTLVRLARIAGEIGDRVDVR